MAAGRFGEHDCGLAPEQGARAIIICDAWSRARKGLHSHPALLQSLTSASQTKSTEETRDESSFGEESKEKFSNAGKLCSNFFLGTRKCPMDNLTMNSSAVASL